MDEKRYRLSILEKILYAIVLILFASGVALYLMDFTVYAMIVLAISIAVSLIMSSEISKDAERYKKLCDDSMWTYEETEWINNKEKTLLSIDALNSEKEDLKTRLDNTDKKLSDKEKEIEELKASLSLNEQDKLRLNEAADENAKLMKMLSLIPNLENENTSINLVKMAKDAVDELSVSINKADIGVTVNAVNDNMIVKADPEKIKILFRNIIDNSVKYMGRAGRLVITISSIEDMIFVVLKDNGLGIAADEVERIFELNYQGSNRISGNGLGLAQAKAIVDYYHGTIYAKSSVNGGMGIYIQIPAN